MATRNIPKRRENPPVKIVGSRGFALGLNQLTHSSAIKKNELAECFNAVFSQNGVLRKRQGSQTVGDARDGDSYVYGLQGIYDIGGNSFVLRIGTSGVVQKYNGITDSWSDITGSPDFSNKRTYILQGYGYVYFMNESDLLSSWDGESWTTYTELDDPEDAPTAAKVGSGTGPRTYYYKYVWFNEIGHTIASSSDNVASMPNTLDTDTYITVTMPEAPEGAVNTGIFRGVEPGVEHYLASIPADQLVYHDNGEDTEDINYLFPDSNTTSGYHFKFGTVFKSTFIGITTELGDDTIVYSGIADNFANFSEGAGGGWFSWRKGDGSDIVAMHNFKEQLYVFKTNKTGVFDFIASADGGATVKDLNMAVGGVSQDSIHPAGNDLRGWGQDGAFSMGNEPNFADVIRSKLLSARIQKTVDSITYSDIDKIASTYYKNLSIWAIPTGEQGDGNNIMAVYDQRYVAWSIWTGMKASCFTKFIDSNNIEHLYYGDAESGEMIEMFQGYNDCGNSINFRISTKQFDAGLPYKYKTFGLVYFIFGLINGSGTRLSLVEDGTSQRTSYGIYANIINQGFGVDQWGTMQFGETTSDVLEDVSGLTVKYADLGSKDLFSVQAQISNSGLNDQVEIMGIFFEYSISEQPLPSTKKLTILS